MGLKFGMDIENWPPENIQELIEDCLDENK